MSDLAHKFASQIDPTFRRGRTQAGMAVGLAATLGRFLPLKGGAYLLKRGKSRATIDEVVGVALPGETTIREFSHVRHVPDASYYYQVVPVGPGGVEAVAGSYGVVGVAFGSTSQAASPPPAAPRELRVAAIAGGKFRLRWVAGIASGRPAVTTYAVYGDAGTGTMDYATPIATVKAASGVASIQGLQTEAYTHGLVVRFGVRARAGSIEEANTVVVSATADAEGPADGVVQAAVFGADE
jgi:hypothetical protein